MLRRLALCLGVVAGCSAVDSQVLVEADSIDDTGRPTGNDAGGDTRPTADTDGDAAASDLAADDVVTRPDAEAGDTLDRTDAADTMSTPDAAPEPYGGPPTLTHVFPLVAVSDGILYVEGTRLARPPNDVRDTRAYVLPDGLPDRIELDVLTGIPGRLILGTPSDYADRVPGRATLRIETPDGTADWEWVYATNDTTFTGKTLVGTGLLGNVYAMQPETRRLPDLDDACAQPEVIAPCPYTSLLAPQINVPDREFDIGFPGLGTALVEWFAIRLTGFLDVPAAGTYSFHLCSDDGSILYLAPGGARVEVINNDGAHSVQCRDGSIELPAGLVPLVLDYFQGPRNRIALTLEWTAPGGTRELIPEERLDLFASPFVP